MEDFMRGSYYGKFAMELKKRIKNLNNDEHFTWATSLRFDARRGFTAGMVKGGAEYLVSEIKAVRSHLSITVRYGYMVEGFLDGINHGVDSEATVYFDIRRRGAKIEESLKILTEKDSTDSVKAEVFSNIAEDELKEIWEGICDEGKLNILDLINSYDGLLFDRHREFWDVLMASKLEPVEVKKKLFNILFDRDM